MTEMSQAQQNLLMRSRAQGSLVVFDVDFAVVFGLEPGILLSRLIYFCRPDSKVGKLVDGERWYYSTYTNWIDKSLSWMVERTLRRMIRDLEEKNIILSYQSPTSHNRTKYYRPNYDVIWDILSAQYPDIYPNMADACGQTDPPQGGQDDRMLINSKPLTVNTSSYEDVGNGQNDQPKRKLRPRDLMFDMVAEVCVMDPVLVGSRIAKASHALKKAGYTSDQVLAFRDYWQRTSYQYKQNKRPPTPEQLIAQIKHSISHKEEQDNYYSADQVNLEELEAERRENDGI